jgi:class 3 adenylate cyclase
MMGDIEEFITGYRVNSPAEYERVLATALFTDIVDSTRRAADMGDHKWRLLLDRHDQLAKDLVERHRGTMVKNTGYGIFAIFDGPGRAVRCALAPAAASAKIGLPCVQAFTLVRSKCEVTM